MEKGAGSLSGVSGVDAEAEDGWVRLTIHPQDGKDVREDIFRLVNDKNWSLREIRRDGGSLEDFFVKVTAEQLGRRGG